LDDARWSRFVTKLMAVNTVFKGAHHILPKVDAVSEPFGVVARSPLFDRAIVEMAFAIPPQLKLRGSVEKYLLKQAVSDLLPKTILDRPKSGMLVPVEGWFKGPLLDVARERLLDGLARYRLFDRGYLERLLAGRLGGLRPRRGVKIWLLVTLESWLRSLEVQ
jgi:asparagine synthase (glutamine-hydrolysing)